MLSQKMRNKTKKWVEKLLTIEDFLMCRYIITTILKETCQITEMFDISKNWKILPELSFVAAGITLRNLRECIRIYLGQSQIYKIIYH